ncbi:MAG TPA: TauD/TfdA family dioxygenase [Jatrophihabitans sp.]|jgi:taurine dioxygenase
MSAPARARLKRTYLDSPFGVVVEGLHWGRPDPETVRELTALLRSKLLIIFRGQASPTHEQLDEFFAEFGRLVLQTYDGTYHYGTFDDDQRNVVTRQHEQNYINNPDAGANELVWHSDQSHRPQLKIMSLLEAVEIVGDVVPTEFRDMYVAYETLPAELKFRLRDKMCVFFDPRQPSPEQRPRLADSMHLVFTPHPQSGRVALYPNDFTRRIVGFDLAESDELLARLREHTDVNAPRLAYHWRQGDIVAWDNVGLQHRRDAMPAGQVRKLRQYEGLSE